MRQPIVQHVQSLVESAFGITIASARSIKGKFDPALLAVREWSSDDVVFDVGANDGRTILRIARRLNFPRFFAFEPASGPYRKLIERTRRLKQVKCFQLAMGEQLGRKTLYLNDIDALNSFSPTWSNGASGRQASDPQTEVVEVATVDHMMAQQRVDFVHLLKIDTEGYEMEVLRGAGQALRDSRIAMVVAEVGFDQSPKAIVPLEEARRYLATFGYRLHGIYTQGRAPAEAPRHWPGAERERYRPQALVYCDALFLCTHIDAPGGAPAEPSRASSQIP